MPNRVQSAVAKGLTFVVFASVAMMTWPALAQERDRPALEQQRNRPAPVAAEAYQPTAFPDRVILTIAGDPAHSLAVTWRTDASVKKRRGAARSGRSWTPVRVPGENRSGIDDHPGHQGQHGPPS